MNTLKTNWLYLFFLLGAFLLISSSCKKDDDNNPPETITDIDGNVYHTIEIGDQVWLVENLKVSHFNNGDPIDIVTDSTIWTNMTTPAYCNYDNNEINSTTYGRLYNWYSVNDSRKIAPQGWHVASNAEWEVLIDHLGGDIVAGGRLKLSGTTSWSSPNTGASNSSGFSALPGGASIGSYSGLNYSGNFWTSTPYNSIAAYNRTLGYNYAEIKGNTGRNYYGYSVRCLMD